MRKQACERDSKDNFHGENCKKKRYSCDHIKPTEELMTVPIPQNLDFIFKGRWSSAICSILLMDLPMPPCMHMMRSSMSAARVR